ncbi:hypothetical protein L6452_10818 [Arctium lappa]|uniref:Uncharacterized protein n=1 Tax=Arctium lappa TaxID=4217 RepID=A0ACB9DN77_ARCLA|nr:hypothetical protein L6452_10818 [Arctium lappa]
MLISPKSFRVFLTSQNLTSRISTETQTSSSNAGRQTETQTSVLRETPVFVVNLVAGRYSPVVVVEAKCGRRCCLASPVATRSIFTQSKKALKKNQLEKET